MNRNKYRHRVEILRRVKDDGAGGYAAETYEKIGETSCQLRDESETEYAAAESARIEHVTTFCMRARDIRSDDMLRYRGEGYAVRRVDAYDHGGREIRVRASLVKSRYTVKGETYGAADD